MNIWHRYKEIRDHIQSQGLLGKAVWSLLQLTIGVLLLASILVYSTGMTTPFVSVSSGSMEPGIQTNDLLIISDFDQDDPPPIADGSTIATSSSSSEESFGEPGDVIVFETPDRNHPVIHRAHHHVEKGEDWVQTVNESYSPNDLSCDDLADCPAPHDGYVTKGDANSKYDQVGDDRIELVGDDQIIGIIEYRVPYAGIIAI